MKPEGLKSAENFLPKLEAQVWISNQPHFCIYFWPAIFLISCEQCERGRPPPRSWMMTSLIQNEMPNVLKNVCFPSVYTEKSFRGARRQTLLSPAGGAPEVISVPLCGREPWEKTEAVTNGIAYKGEPVCGRSKAELSAEGCQGWNQGFNS